jgi:hypothetical protein
MLCHSNAIVPGRFVQQRRARFLGRLTASSFVFSLASACVDPDSSRPPLDSPEGLVAAWDYASDSPSEGGDRVLSLWPAESRTPTPKVRYGRMSQEAGKLVVLSETNDPQVQWQFEVPVVAAALAGRVHSSAPGSIQVFWNTERCPTFRESCSQVHPLVKGEQTIGFAFGFRSPIRELRLDVVDRAGVRIELLELALGSTPILNTLWEPGSAQTRTELTPDGLKVVARDLDPWVWLGARFTARSVETVELVQEAPAGTVAQLFWRGSECPHYEERCSVNLAPVDGGVAVQAAFMRFVDTWRGEVEGLRIDPGNQRGAYLVHRVALSNAHAR